MRRRGVQLFRAGIQILAALTCLSSPAAADTLVTIEVPGATQTFAQAINAHGDVVGFYVSADGHWHGFLWSDGAFTVIDMPDATYTALFGINDHGHVVGQAQYGDGFFDSYGFVIRDGVTEVIPGPVGEGPTTPRGINNRGDIVGTYRLTGAGRTGFWLDRHGTFRTINAGDQSIVHGINDRGVMVGQKGDVVYSGFSVDTVGNATIFELPDTRSTYLFGLNARGVVVGMKDRDAFVLDREGIRFVEVPSSTSTTVFGINAQGTLVGVYTDGEQQRRGFVLIK